MKSKDTKSAQKMMKDAADNAHKDGKFLNEYAKKEKKIKEDGSKEMKSQKSKLSKLKIRG